MKDKQEASTSWEVPHKTVENKLHSVLQKESEFVTAVNK